MALTYKNRVIVSFSEEDPRILKVGFATSEQANVFMYYMQKCVAAESLDIKREVMIDGAWVTSGTGKVNSAEHDNNKRANRTPFKLEIRVMAVTSHEEFKLECYCFSSVDLDFMGLLLDKGTSNKQVIVTGYNRNKETKEWERREFCTFVPRKAALLFNSLTEKDKADAIEYMHRLKSMS